MEILVLNYTKQSNKELRTFIKHVIDITSKGALYYHNKHIYELEFIECLAA